MIFETYSKIDWLSFNREVRTNIGQDTFERSEALRRMGKDVSKMRLIS